MLHLKDHFLGKSHVIWDWNGTLLDDLDLAVDTINQVLNENALDPISREKYLEFFRFPVVEYYKLIGFDFAKVPFEIVARRFIELYQGSVHLKAKLHEGVPALLEAVKAAGNVQSVLSAAEQNHLREILGHHGILNHFDHVYGLSDNHAASKVQRGRELLEASGCYARDTVLVGDTDHDLEVGKALGVDVLLLGDGHQAFERLTALHERVLRSRKL